MKRYIDEELVTEDILQRLDALKGSDFGTSTFRDGLADWYARIMSDLRSIPTADVVEVVRCKDCKYASPNGEYGCKAYHFKLYETHEMKADDFCSRGERRDDA